MMQIKSVHSTRPEAWDLSPAQAPMVYRVTSVLSFYVMLIVGTAQDVDIGLFGPNTLYKSDTNRIIFCSNQKR